MSSPSITLPAQLANRRSALIVGHPGHELRVHGWLELAQPVVCVLTDGSGHTGRSRLEATNLILNRAGASHGSVFGRFRDVDIYEAILNNEAGLFISLAHELAELMVSERADYVVGDAIEGYNPTHDLCRAVINCAVELARKTSRRRIESYDFLTVGESSTCAEGSQAGFRIELDPQAFERKLAAATSYAELFEDVRRMIQQVGKDAFRVECLRPSKPQLLPADEEIPFYESYGATRVEAGVYSRVIRYREHVLPIVQALLRCAE